MCSNESGIENSSMFIGAPPGFVRPGRDGPGRIAVPSPFALNAGELTINLDGSPTARQSRSAEARVPAQPLRSFGTRRHAGRAMPGRQGSRPFRVAPGRWARRAGEGPLSNPRRPSLSHPMQHRLRAVLAASGASLQHAAKPLPPQRARDRAHFGDVLWSVLLNENNDL
jgi:hypothetical protein